MTTTELAAHMIAHTLLPIPARTDADRPTRIGSLLIHRAGARLHPWRTGWRPVVYVLTSDLTGGHRVVQSVDVYSSTAAYPTHAAATAYADQWLTDTGIPRRRYLSAYAPIPA